jgi:hypothetical protein
MLSSAELLAENAALTARVAALEYRLDHAERTMADFHASVVSIIATSICLVLRLKSHDIRTFRHLALVASGKPRRPFNSR